MPQGKGGGSSQLLPVDAAKQFILNFAREFRMVAGQPLPVQLLHFRVTASLTQREIDAAPQAIDMLVKEGVFEKRDGRKGRSLKVLATTSLFSVNVAANGSAPIASHRKIRVDPNMNAIWQPSGTLWEVPLTEPLYRPGNSR